VAAATGKKKKKLVSTISQIRDKNLNGWGYFVMNIEVFKM
jgi:hypothetical protein